MKTFSITLSIILVASSVAYAHNGVQHPPATPSEAAKRAAKVMPLTALNMEAQIESALQEALAELPRATNLRLKSAANGVAPQVRLLGTQLKRSHSYAQTRHEVVINLSADVLAYGVGTRAFEDILHTLHQRAYAPMHERAENISFTILIEGIALNDYLAFEKELTSPTLGTLSTSAAQMVFTKSAAGRRVALSPGHGYWFGAGRWQLQRSFFSGIVEDFINHDFIAEVNINLIAAGASIRNAREMNKQAGNGESGFPKWQEAARYYVKSLGVPESVWNSLSTGDDLSDDIRVRPLYANWQDANGINSEVLVSIHNNGALMPNTAFGTETLYDTDNGFGVESKRLADLVHNKIISAIRTQYNPNWPDRRVKGSAGSFGENRVATRPAILIEVAFMDTKTPDNDSMQDLRFRQIVAKAISDGVAEFFATQVDTTPPTSPTNVATVAASQSQIDLKWAAATDDVGVAAYRVSRNGAEVGVTTGLSLTDTGLTAATSYNYTVAARDVKGNWSAETPIATAATFPPTPYLGLWWAGEAESGWGMSVTQHNGIIFLAIFTYDANGTPTWYVMSNCAVAGNTCNGKLYRVTGGRSPIVPWVVGGLNVVEVGDGSLVFTDANNGVFNALIDNVPARKVITRQDVKSGTVANIIDFSDLWWNANESGWGVSLTHANSNIFATWFAYDTTGKAIWYVAPACTLLAATTTTSCNSELYSVTGGTALTAPWVSGRTVVKREGSFNLQFTDASRAVMNYTIGGDTTSRVITRQPF
jgi:N-acetylmuramoyl-L-alanine amidase